MITTITKKSVSITPHVNTVTLNLLYTDGETVLIDRDFSGVYYLGEKVESALTHIKVEIEAAIANYDAEQKALASTDLDTAVSVISAAIKAKVDILDKAEVK